MFNSFLFIYIMLIISASYSNYRRINEFEKRKEAIEFEYVEFLNFIHKKHYNLKDEEFIKDKNEFISSLASVRNPI